MQTSTRKHLALPPTARAGAGRERGSSLALALLLVSGAAMLSVLTLQRGLAQWKNQSASSAQKMAFYYAEAGIAEAVDDLRAGGSGNVGTREIPALFGNGAVWVECLEDANGVQHLTSTGLHGGTAYRLCQSLERPRLPLGEFGFFGSHEVELGESVQVSQLDVPFDEGGVVDDVEDVVEDVLGGVLGGGRQRIALPTPLPVQEASPTLIGSNGEIHLGLGALIQGGALPGPGALVDLILGAVVEGSMLPEERHRELPEISMPMSTTTATLAMAARQQLTLASGTHEYESIDLAGRAVLTITGPASVYVENLRVPALGKLVLDTTNGPVHVYVGDTLSVAANSAIENTSGEASDVLFLVDGRGVRDRDGDGAEDVEQPVEWGTTQPFAGVLYAPFSQVTLPAGSAITGGIAALGLSVGDDSTLVFDPRIEDIELRAKSYRFVSWRVLQIPAPERALIAQDLVRTARERGDTPQPVAASRIAAASTFRFSNSDGEEFTYRGASLAAITGEVVDAVLPVVARTPDVPEFAKYEEDADDRGTSDEVMFKRAYNQMLESMSSGTGNRDRWATALETGDIPAATWDSIWTNSILVEPFISALKEPRVRAELQANITSSWLPPKSRRLINRAIDLYP
ncbi:hypothetical protein Pla163_04680 [Planctomycetes bacterium Pla163]|uniref:DUF7305 domain-containing protein n=1 Tax=Rohdeia mirabilis TaxID=2528008 RepID=A0A518CVX1_9BACT|nr:hypothetical protein Pla163_04680 [Planctomycetes bacterium Pla163]